MEREILEHITVTKNEHSMVTIAGELPWSELEKHRSVAVGAVSKNLKIDGFREGHIPEHILIQKVGDMAIISEMAERAIARAYPEIVKHHALDVVGYPSISITKIAKDNPLGFSMTVAVMPTITLPDYTKIAKDINKHKESKEVTDDDVEKQIADILRQKVAYERLQSKAQKNDTEHVHGPECAHEHDEASEHVTEEDAKTPTPELTDELVQTLGQKGQFTDVADFKAKIREHLSIEKIREVDSAHRAKITDAIIEHTTIELPKIMIDSEINQMFAQMEDDLTRAQLSMSDYLEHIKKTRDDLTKEWTPAAEKRAKLQLILNEIAKKEHIEPHKEILDSQVKHLMEQYKDADESRVRVYVSSILTNEETLKKLEEMA